MLSRIEEGFNPDTDLLRDWGVGIEIESGKMGKLLSK